ncbi:MAG: acetamidase/formamidase family protein, partial [Yaniella sp.]|nr:acetamidase/formamidase family protein [Yaniella sp.]
MLGNIFPLDSSKPFTAQEKTGHNRYHPEIPPVETVRPGDSFRVDSREWFDGAIKNDDSADDILNAPMKKVHGLSGPFRIEGAQPGDLLIVDILDVGPIPQEQGPLAGQGWGYTGIFARSNGGSFLVDQFPDAYKAVWDFQGPWATSRHIPGVRFEGLTHPGIMATAPSPEMLAKWNKREGDLMATNPDRVPPLALPPAPEE